LDQTSSRPAPHAPKRLFAKKLGWRAYALARRVKGELLGALVEIKQRVRERGTGLTPFESRYSSQHGEDGVLLEIFRRIGTGPLPFFAEFGVEGGHETNCGYLARGLGWHGLMIEGNPTSAATLAKVYADYPNVRTRCEFLTRDNIDGIFRSSGVPVGLDVLSVDVDGNDYWLWEALADFKPRVVVVEYNAALPPPMDWKMKYDEHHRWDGTMRFGASLCALYELGTRLGYSLIGTESSGVNAFFIRNDELSRSKFPALRPEQAFHLPYHGFFHRMHPYRKLVDEEPAPVD